MTEIGKMIREDALIEGIKKGKQEGIKAGKETGKKEGKSEIVIRQLIKKFKKIPDEYVEKIKLLSDEMLDGITTDIFDIESIEDLKKYF